MKLRKKIKKNFQSEENSNKKIKMKFDKKRKLRKMKK
jgi:hypothetical protein